MKAKQEINQLISSGLYTGSLESLHRRLTDVQPSSRIHHQPKALREVLQYNTSFSSEAMQAGIQQEPLIIKDYLAQQEQNGNNSITVDKCGFFVSKMHPFLGASPDSIFSDNESSGLLEMKYIQMEESETLEEALIRKRICVKNSGILEINKKHQYYFQVQQQMFVANKEWNDFVVKGSRGRSIFIKRVMFDSSFWKTVLHKLEFFFNTYMLPEIAYPKVKYGQERLAPQLLAKGNHKFSESLTKMKLCKYCMVS